MASRGPAQSIAVVIPAVNASETITRQLLALTSQSLLPDEIIVADNGSTDATKEIVEAFDHGLVRFVDASARLGPSFARNVGILHSTGKIILLCDADDIVACDWVEQMAAALDTLDSVGGALLPFTGADPNWNTLPSRSGLRHGFLPAPATANAGCWREVWAAVDGFNEDLVVGQDLDFFWRVQLAGYSYGFAEKSVVAYRQRSDWIGKFRQEFKYGQAEVALYALHRRHGMRRSSLGRVMWRYVHLILSTYRLVLSSSGRRTWIGHAGKNLGRLAGSIERGVLFL